MQGREVFIEIARLGDSMKVSAIDAETGLEAVVIGPASALRADLETLALKKLQRMLADAEKPAARAARPGKLV